MDVIITIGWQKYIAVIDPSDFPVAAKLLGSMLPVDDRYVSGQGTVYYPADDTIRHDAKIESFAGTFLNSKDEFDALKDVEELDSLRKKNEALEARIAELESESALKAA